MRYLFGDSSESSLETNYLAFVRDAIEFGVLVLQADVGLGTARERRAVRSRAAEDAVRAIGELGQTAVRLTEPLAKGDQPINRCASAIVTAISEVVKREANKVRADLTAELEQLDTEMQRLRVRCAAALNTLLGCHELPDAVETLTVRWHGSGYEARSHQRAPYGVESTVALEIADGSPFGHDLRVGRVVDAAEAQNPEAAGSLKKVGHVLGTHHIAEVVVASTGVTVRLRPMPESGEAGVDIVVGRNGGVKVERTDKAGERDASQDERDAPGLRIFAGYLERAVRELRHHRRSLLDAQFEGKPLANHEQPREFLDRLIAAMAPVVHEIARHSLSPRELVLKRLLGGDRREEIFLSRAELAHKLEPLSASQRRIFAPLGILDDPSAPALVVAPPLPVDAPPRPTPPPPPGARAAAPASDDTGEAEPSIVIEAELPPRHSLPPPSGAVRSIRKSVPPPPPRRRTAPVGAEAAAAVEAALRDPDNAQTQALPVIPPDEPST